MSMKAVFLNGSDEATAQGRLHQWDRGRTLEIHADDLPAAVEVHFAYAGMDAAIVYTCAVVGGVATVAIPNLCLQQSGTVKAWVYKVGETTGETIKTITLPLTPRTRPDDDDVVPEEFVSKYTQAMEALDDKVNDVDATVDATVSAGVATMNAAAAACVEEVDARKAELSDPQYVAKRAETVYKDGVTMFSAPISGKTLPRAGFYLLTCYASGNKTYNIQTVVYWDGSSSVYGGPASMTTSKDGNGNTVTTFNSYAISNTGAIALREHRNTVSHGSETTDITDTVVIRYSRIG